MSLLTRPKLQPQERFDLEDFNLLLSAINTDWKSNSKQFWSNAAYILKGFQVSNLNTPSPAQIVVDGSTLINANNSGEFSWFVGPAGASPLLANLIPGSRNYLELQLFLEDDTPLPRAFWDQTANSGSGAEFTQTVNTVTNVKVQVNVLSGGFSGSTDTVKLAIVDTDSGNNIISILDRRDLFFRLGTGENPLNQYAWASQTEPASTITLNAESGTFVAGETLTFSGGATATVTSGGTTTIQANLFSGDNFAPGNTVVGGTSGANGTVVTVQDSFSGADKSILDLKSMLAALCTEIRALKGTPEWFNGTFASMIDVLKFINSLIMPSVSVGEPRWSWDGTNLSITANGSGGSDVIATIRLIGSSSILNMERADGLGGSAVIPIPDGSVLFVQLPTLGANRNYSGNGSGATNYQVVPRASFVSNASNYWIAYNDGGTVVVRGGVDLDPGESQNIDDAVARNLLSAIGLPTEVSTPSYSSNIRGTTAESIISRVGVLTDAVGDEQEDRSGYLRSSSLVTWSGTQLSFPSDIVLEFLNTKSGTITTHSVLTANSPISLSAGQMLYVAINRTTTPETLTPIVASSLPAQTQANKDIFVLFRVGSSGSFLHIPLHKQIIEPGQSIRLGVPYEVAPTLIGATIENALIPNYEDFTEQSSSPSAPSAGNLRLYTKNDGNVYVKDSSGVEREIGSGSGGINYILNPDAETSTSGWAAYANAASATPVNGTGGSPAVSITRQTSSPLRGAASFRINKDAANRQGQGVSYDFFIAPADEAKPLSVSFEYTPSANFVAGDNSDIRVWLYDITNAQLIQPAPYTIQGGFGTNSKFLATFQTNSNSTSYRLIFHVATTSALAWTFDFDNVIVGPQTLNYGTPASDWTPYNLLVTATISNPTQGTNVQSAYWRRVGDSMEIIYQYRQSAIGSVGNGTYLFSLPPGYSIDTTKCVVDNTTFIASKNTVFGVCNAGNTDTAGSLDIGHGAVVGWDATHLWMVIEYSPTPGSEQSIGSYYLGYNGVPTWHEFRAVVPILGWSSNVLMSNDTDTRVVAASYYLDSNLSIPNGSNTYVGLSSSAKRFDTHNAYAAFPTFQYNIPVPGIYRITFETRWDVNGTGERVMFVEKNGNGTFIEIGGGGQPSSTNNTRVNGSIDLQFVAGDYLKFSVSQTSGGSLLLTGDSLGKFTYWTIERLSGPSAIAASEKIVARYHASGGQSIPSGSSTVVNYDLKDIDTHGTIATGASWTFTAPVAGMYEIGASARFENGETWTQYAYQSLQLWKNGSLYSILSETFAQATVTAPGINFFLTGTEILQLNAGDTLNIQITQTQGSSQNLINQTPHCHIYIKKV